MSAPSSHACKFCDGYDTHDCPGGSYLDASNRSGQVLPGKLDASIFYTECRCAFRCHCARNWQIPTSVARGELAAAELNGRWCCCADEGPSHPSDCVCSCHVSDKPRGGFEFL